MKPIEKINDREDGFYERKSYHIDETIVDKLNEVIDRINEPILAKDNLIKAAKDLIENWEKRMGGDKEELKNNKQSGFYWSPSASMVSSEFIDALRKAVEKASPVV